MTLRVTLSGSVGNGFALDLAFELPAQGVTALLGPSGSGKTSVLRAIAGLEHYRGRISFSGETWQDERRFVPPHLRRVGTVFQGVGLLPHLTVRQNLDYAARRAPKGPFVSDDVITRFGLASLIDRAPARLSGGEAQRANIARTFLSQPRLLLMDEPLSALDTDTRADLFKAIQALVTAAPIPAIYVTHDLAEAEQLCQSFIRLDGGILRDKNNSCAVQQIGAVFIS